VGGLLHVGFNAVGELESILTTERKGQKEKQRTLDIKNDRQKK
jgi:hypothetical protein